MKHKEKIKSLVILPWVIMSTCVHVPSLIFILTSLYIFMYSIYAFMQQWNIPLPILLLILIFYHNYLIIRVFFCCWIFWLISMLGKDSWQFPGLILRSGIESKARQSFHALCISRADSSLKAIFLGFDKGPFNLQTILIYLQMAAILSPVAPL